MQVVEGTVFTFEGNKFEVDLVGPKTTLLIDENKNWLSVDTNDLERFLDSLEDKK